MGNPRNEDRKDHEPPKPGIGKDAKASTDNRKCIGLKTQKKGQYTISVINQLLVFISDR